jgi:catechol 2,3-dioxygenase-like lactoylglutathione lyase family enzyme
MVAYFLRALPSNQSGANMLADNEVLATIAVKNLAAAKQFYENILGFKPTGPNDQPSVVNYMSGKSRLLVYESQFAGTNKATTATWEVGNQVAALAKELAAKGAKFEHYDMPGAKLEGDVHVMGDMKVAWCKDPDGNILAFVGT